MSTFFFVCGAIFVVACIACVWRRSYLHKHRYVGFGFVLGWEDGSAFVLSRLIDSPAGRAGIENGERLIGCESQMFDFASRDELVQWSTEDTRSLGVGDTRTYHVMRDNKICSVPMVAEIIQGPIPVYEIPPKRSGCGNDYRVTQGITYCRRTGQIVVLEGPSDEYIEELLQ